MKKISFFIALIATVFLPNSFAQTSPVKNLGVLAAYYDVRNALVAGKVEIAALKAEELKAALNTVKSIESKTALQKNSGLIAGSKNIKSQRDAFANLSADMITLVKAEKLNTEPVYQLTCPMKNSSWLSNEKTVKNPYYGSAMLSCGKVVGTL